MFIVMMDNIKSLLILKRSDSDAIDNIPASYISKWNKQVQHLLENKSFKSILQRFMDIDISKNRLKIILVWSEYELIHSNVNNNIYRFQ